ncbi:DUF4246 domain-containing protein [Aspergillus lucknowensis]|uniref:Uncharacterized protein n=1 Tax=Aspergillus lucknowensis TaxID=176173 RepID=A0ABR4LCM4_9EURO
MSESTPLDLPGLTLPLNFHPKRCPGEFVYANALDGKDILRGYVGYTFTLREIVMMQIMESLTNKPKWTEKVFNEEIVANWRDELVNDDDVTDLIMDYMIAELRWKAAEYNKTGIVTSYDPGVVKSDTAIPPDLQRRLGELVKKLEDEGPKDYHPDSDDKVVDLVHPSLFPLVYGRTRVLRDRVIGREDCLLSVGLGEVAKVPDLPKLGFRQTHSPYSNRFQWLPCDVKFDNGGGDGGARCRIASYINNLHPTKHHELYGVIEEILTRVIPLWNATLTRDDDVPRRIRYTQVEYLPPDEPESGLGGNHRGRRDALQLKQPEPSPFTPPVPRHVADLQAHHAEKGLQVIVKLANIELTPEKPTYEGGSWHIEGKLNERICATAIYYFSSENITSNMLFFRCRGDDRAFDDLRYKQNEHQFLRVFGFEPYLGRADSGDITQFLGGVECQQGRLLSFPNTLQHCVEPFELADRTKPGHRKILAFFLIDPSRRVISTANVPPQREDWCTEWGGGEKKKLPVELQTTNMSDVEFKPMGLDEAKGYREKLMEERGMKAEGARAKFEMGGFHLCEH